ncbi:MarR family winged helix-turn-helix transcriptional regulator [Ktedonobacter racemifer]|uniref:MarR family winged helix-turn-helix transcriptional regulator n=1 Tax=Ktedonobacter racemifer TaxID=363277 RepID=UPI003B75BA24
MLNRLEEAELVRRERDPNDGRRVIVQLERGKDEIHKIGPIFDSLGRAWDELASDYDDEQIAFLLEFLKRSNVLSRKEINRLQEAPSSEGEIFSAPLLDLKSARLVVSSGVSRLTLRAIEGMAELYQSRFEGPAPDVKAKDGVVNYPLSPPSLGSEWAAARGRGHAQQKHPLADYDPGRSIRGHRRTERPQSRRVGGQEGSQHNPPGASHAL